MYQLTQASLSSIPNNVLLWLLFVVLAATSVGTGAIGEWFIDSIRPIRKLLAGDDDIEGYWAGWTVDRRTGALANVAWVVLTFRDGAYRSEGIGWYAPKGRALNWQTNQSTFSDERLIYQYTVQWIGEPGESVRGVGSIEFDRDSPNQRFQRCSGEFVDLKIGGNYLIFAERLKFSRAKRPPTNDADRKALVADICNARLPEIARQIRLANQPSSPTRTATTE